MFLFFISNKDDEQIRRLLGEMNFVGAHQIDEMMKDETKRTMVYQFIEEKGGIDSVQRKHRAQSVKQQAPQVEIIKKKIFFVERFLWQPRKLQGVLNDNLNPFLSPQ